MLHPPTSPRTSTSAPVTEQARQARPCSRRKTAAPLLCPYHNCPRSFRAPSYLKNHLRTHTGEKPFGCPLEGCNSSFAQSSAVSRHLRTFHATNGPFVCPHKSCRHAFTGASGRTYHLRVFHSGEKPFVCPHEGCHHAFAKLSHLDDHFRIHSEKKPFVCPWEGCRHRFRQARSLTYHRRTHSGEKPFVCPYEGCRHASAQSGNLTRHLRIHSGEKPFICPHEDCSKRFTQSNHRTSHLRNHNREQRLRGQKTLTSLTRLPDAGSAYPDARSHSSATGRHTAIAGTHLHVHGIRRPHVCHYPDCDRRFLQLLALKMHQRRHTSAPVGAGSCQDHEQKLMHQHSHQPRWPARDSRHSPWCATGKRSCCPDQNPVSRVTGHQRLKLYQRPPVPTHVPAALPLPGVTTVNPKAIYCRVIARVSDGTVYNTHRDSSFPVGQPSDTQGKANRSWL